MTLWIDDREPRQVIDKLRELVDSVIVGRYESGDYICGELAIERKELRDFMSSLYNGRYWKQIEVLRDTFEKPIVVFEGDIDRATRPMRVLEGHIRKVALNDAEVQQIRSSYVSTILGWKIPVIATEDFEETAQRIAELYYYVNGDRESNEPKPAVKKAITPEEARENMLCVVYGIGPTTARKILKEFTFQDLINLEEPNEIKNVVGRIRDDSCKLLLEVF